MKNIIGEQINGAEPRLRQHHVVRLMRSRCAQGAEHNCEDVNERCGAVAPQELPLIVGGGRICEKRHIR